MPGLFGNAPRPRDYSACSGCSLCLLVCPVWRHTHDLTMTPHGRAKALQHGANAQELADSADACTLCAACEPVCPEQIGIVEMTLALRGKLNRPESLSTPARRSVLARSSILLLPDAALLEHPHTLQQTVAALGGERAVALAADEGLDIVRALEAGAPIAEQRRQDFLSSLAGAGQVVVADGLLLRWLRQERLAAIGLGFALSRLDPVKQRLRGDDLYVIEPRAYHLDYERLVKHYDGLRRSTGCALNLDLQRIAIPARMRSRSGNGCQPDDAAQTRWLLHGRKISRIVVEDIGDIAAFRAVDDRPVLHVSELP